MYNKIRLGDTMKKRKHKFLIDTLGIDINHDETRTDYSKRYTITSIILLFFIAGLIGFAWETLLEYKRSGVIRNRGFLTGPIIPIYGHGANLALLLGYKYRKTPVKHTLLIMFYSTILEYVSSYVLELMFGVRWWNYYKYPLNINGRVCLRGILIFALLSSAFIYVIAPTVDKILKKINKKLIIFLCVLFLSLMAIDTVFSFIEPRVGVGITNNYKPRR